MLGSRTAMTASPVRVTSLCAHARAIDRSLHHAGVAGPAAASPGRPGDLLENSVHVMRQRDIKDCGVVTHDAVDLPCIGCADTHTFLTGPFCRCGLASGDFHLDR